MFEIQCVQKKAQEIVWNIIVVVILYIFVMYSPKLFSTNETSSKINGFLDQASLLVAGQKLSFSL